MDFVEDPYTQTNPPITMLGIKLCPNLQALAQLLYALGLSVVIPHQACTSSGTTTVGSILNHQY